jgi:jumonji domain-containing protein 2
MAPIFEPTMDEFRDFKKYVERIEKECKAGICKIIPPPEWHRNLSYDNLNNLIIPTPIKQYVSGTKGAYQLMLVESPKCTVEKFQQLADQAKMPKSSKYQENDSIDRVFWKNLKFNPPTYGADMAGTLFNERVRSWNVGHLPSILNVLGAHQNLPGITTPYLYFGMWKAMFAWHVEDMNLFSINYLHFGEPKSWYAVAPGKFFSLRIVRSILIFLSICRAWS